MDVDATTPLALAVRYLDQDPIGWKVLIQAIPPQSFMDLLQESLMWNARFIQKIANDDGRDPSELAREIITNTIMKEYT
jgi:hypothetical protein